MLDAAAALRSCSYGTFARTLQPHYSAADAELAEGEQITVESYAQRATAAARAARGGGDGDGGAAVELDGDDDVEGDAGEWEGDWEGDAGWEGDGRDDSWGGGGGGD